MDIKSKREKNLARLPVKSLWKVNIEITAKTEDGDGDLESAVEAATCSTTKIE